MNSKFSLPILLLFFVTSCSGGGSQTSTSSNNSPPIAEFSMPTNAFNGVTVNFDASMSIDSDGIISTYSFDFGDNSPIITQASPYFSHSYNSSRTYSVTLNVTDNQGLSKTVSKQITISNSSLPIADFSMPSNALRGSTLNIDASLSKDNDGNISTYSFDFGDGTPTVIQTFPVSTHSYSNTGTYSVSLFVTDNQGLSSNTVSKQITIGVIGSTPVNISNSTEISQAPTMVLDNSGATNLIWYEYGDTMFSRSVDGGRSFSPGKYVFPIIPGYSKSEAQIALATNGIHVVSTMFNNMVGGAEIVYARSTDGGATFSSPMFISSIDSLNSTVPSIITDGGSRVAITWHDVDVNLISQAGGNFFIRSDDGGNTFTTPIKLTDPGSFVGNIAMTDQYTYIVYQTPIGQFFNQTQIFFSRSNVGSTNFTTPVNISNSSLQAYGPKIKTDSRGYIYVFWLEASDNSDQRIMYTVSADNGISFKTPLKLTDPSLNAICFSLATGSIGQVYVAWSTGDLFSNNFNTYLNYSTDGGVTFSTSLKMPAITNEGNCPKIIDKGSGQLGAVWNSPFYSPNHIMGDIFYSNIQASLP